MVFERDIALLAAVQVTGLEEPEELNEYGTLSVSNKNMLLRQHAGAMLEIEINGCQYITSCLFEFRFYGF